LGLEALRVTTANQAPLLVLLVEVSRVEQVHVSQAGIMPAIREQQELDFLIRAVVALVLVGMPLDRVLLLAVEMVVSA
jgi:hypothetical protein